MARIASKGPGMNHRGTLLRPAMRDYEGHGRDTEEEFTTDYTDRHGRDQKTEWDTNSTNRLEGTGDGATEFEPTLSWPFVKFVSLRFPSRFPHQRSFALSAGTFLLEPFVFIRAYSWLTPRENH